MYLYENRRVKHARVIFLVGKLRWNTLCNFQMDEIIALFHLKRKKKNLQIYLNSHRCFLVYCLNTSKQK